ncbi:MAG: HlyD family secretion protein [Burkholderiaceae bacterium]|jgi:membrane fusion protein (multidrug efflux system)|nr:HlyD family secretion protein [Burkholderiaceae bacterium]
MKKSHKLIGLVALAAAMGVGTVYAWAVANRFVSTDNAYLKIDSVGISPRVGGYVVAVEVKDNQKVKSGDVLVRIDPTDFEVRLAQAGARLVSREAALKTMEQRKLLGLAEVDQARYALEAAHAQAAKAASDHQRDSGLFEQGVVSVAQFDASTLNMRVAVSTESRMRAQLDAAHKQLAVLDAQASQQRAELEQARAETQLLEIDLKNATLIAPSDGVVGDKTVEIGQLVRAGSQVLKLVSARQAYVVANFKETQMTSLKLQQPVSVKVDAYPELRLSGHIESMAPATGAEFSLLPPENATGNFTKIVQRVPVRIVLDEAQQGLDRLRSGMSVNVRVDTLPVAANTADKAVAGPSGAVSLGRGQR